MPCPNTLSNARGIGVRFSYYSTAMPQAKEEPAMDPKKQPFKVAAIQYSPVLFDRDGTIEKIIQAIGRCGLDGVRLAVFPETFVPNYPYFAWVHPPALISASHVRLYEQAVDVPGPATEAIGSEVRRTGIVLILGVNERDGGSLYNTQLVFDANGTLVGKRRKIMPTFHERMIWGWGDGSGLRVFETSVGRIGALICWEHYMPLARYALIVQGEELHCSHFPGSMGGDSMSRQIDAAIRHHAMESGAFVINATGWLTEKQREELCPDPSLRGYLKGGICTGIVAPHGAYLSGPLPEGEGMAVAEIDLRGRIRQKNLLDTVGHYSRPDILRLSVNRSPWRKMEDIQEVFEEAPQREARREVTPTSSGGGGSRCVPEGLGRGDLAPMDAEQTFLNLEGEPLGRRTGRPRLRRSRGQSRRGGGVKGQLRRGPGDVEAGR